MPNKTCLSCGSSIVGRIDKKFCDDHCRSSFNNLKAIGLNQKLRQINHALKKNRMILSHVFCHQTDGQVQTTNRKLQEMGFHFKYHTHLEVTEQGETCFCSYDFGIIPNGDIIKVILLSEQN